MNKPFPVAPELDKSDGLTYLRELVSRHDEIEAYRKAAVEYGPFNVRIKQHKGKFFAYAHHPETGLYDLEGTYLDRSHAQSAAFDYVIGINQFAYDDPSYVERIMTPPWKSPAEWEKQMS